MKRGDRSNVMSEASTQARHVSAASLVIATSHRETREFAFICRCTPPPNTLTHPPSSPQPVAMTTVELHPGKRCVGWEKEDYWGQWSLRLPLSLTHIHSPAFPQRSAWLCPSTYQDNTLVFHNNRAKHVFMFVVCSINRHPGDMLYILIIAPCLMFVSLF